MYQIYPSDSGVDILVCFPLAQYELIFPFRDKLAEALLMIDAMRVNRVQGYPLPPDSILRFFSDNHAKDVETFFQKRRPGFFSRLVNSAAWLSFQKEENLVNQMIDAEIETSHDFPCIVVHSRIHSEESMSMLIEKVATEMKLDMSRNKQLGPIRNVVTSNEKFELNISKSI